MREFLVVSLVAVTLSSALAAHELTPQETANAALVREMIDAVNRRNLDELDRMITPDMVRHSTATAGVEIRSLEEFKAFLRSDFVAVPDSVITIEHLIAQDDLVAVHAIYAGTQQGPMGPFPATGKPVEGPFLSFIRVEDGKIAEMWVEWDNLSMLIQLGHISPPASIEQ